jgi:transcription elongation factor GreB
MSKAFTRESDDVPELPAVPRQVSVLPPGAKNYMTPAGAQRLRQGLERLVLEERPRLAALPSDNDARRQLQVIDQRIADMQRSAQSAVIVPPPAAPDGQVRFGATVSVRDRTGIESRYRIVGIDETDLDRGWVSWLSPIAKALLNARLGQRVRFRFPAGEEELEILGMTYE